jgi:hypothetical protein
MGFTCMAEDAFRDLSSVERAATRPPSAFLSDTGFWC